MPTKRTVRQPTKRTVRQPTKKSKKSKRATRKRTIRRPTKGVYDIWKGLEIDRSNFPTLKLGGKRKSKKSRRKSQRKNKKRNNKSKRRRRRRKSMKGGMTMGEKFTGIPYNATPEHQYPLSSKLNTSIPIGQMGGGILDSLGLGEISTIKNSLFNGLSNARNTWIGKEHSISTSPSIHPLMNKEVRYNVPDVNKAFNESVAAAISYKA